MKTREQVVQDPNSATALELNLASIEGVVPVIRAAIEQNNARELRRALGLLIESAAMLLGALNEATTDA